MTFDDGSFENAIPRLGAKYTDSAYSAYNLHLMKAIITFFVLRKWIYDESGNEIDIIRIFGMKQSRLSESSGINFNQFVSENKDAA